MGLLLFDLIFVHIPDRDFSSLLAIEMYGRPFFAMPFIIESTTVVYDVHTYLYTYYYVKSLQDGFTNL